MPNQKAIDGALLTIDKLIALHEAKLVLLKRHKKGLIQKFPAVNTKTHCPDCRCPWEDHDFGVPKPYCP